MIRNTGNSNAHIKNNQGSMTVELALIMPFILTILIILIYYSIFLYNRQMADTICISSVISGLEMEHSSASQIKSALEKELKTMCKDKFLLQPNYNYQITVNMFTIKAELEIKEIIPFSGLVKRLGMNHQWTYKAKKNAIRTNPAKVLWEKDLMNQRFVKKK